MVTLSPQPDQEEPYCVVVGLCGTIDEGGQKIQDFTSDWEELIARHYPAGTGVGGIWMRLKEGEGLSEARDFINSLVNKDDMEVNLPSLQMMCYHILILLQGIFGSKSLLVTVSGSSDGGVGGSDRVKMYQFDSSHSPIELVPVDCVSSPDLSVCRYLSQHTALLRVCAVLSLFATPPTNSKNQRNLLHDNNEGHYFTLQLKGHCQHSWRRSLPLQFYS